ncbi:LacI family DNA-binding transcriptional regulator [Microbacterium sp. A204]|uniref:LacI family DNA-binding transcriptional regulator n=1 Tax=Microbacterium sp. A204 TaxID=3457321 RepID=UPI003FD1D5BF
MIPPLRKPTIRNVADAAGVSAATVSYVLNETRGQTITEQTRNRVLSAASELGYVPHSAARALREGMSRIVLLKVGSMLGGHSLDRFIVGMNEELRAHQHALLVTAGPDTIDGGAPAEALGALMPRAVLDLPALLADADANHPLFAIVDGYRTGLAFHTLTQLRHLAEGGHREIAFALPFTLGRAPAISVEEASRIAADLRIERIHPLHIALGEDPHQRIAAVRTIAESTSVTAVAASSDDVAFGVLNAMESLGLHAPRDLAVIGFDDGMHGQLWRPALTTVSIDAESFGRRAALLMLGRDPGAWVQAPSWVIVRETT